MNQTKIIITRKSRANIVANHITTFYPYADWKDGHGVWYSVVGVLDAAPLALNLKPGNAEKLCERIRGFLLGPDEILDLLGDSLTEPMTREEL